MEAISAATVAQWMQLGFAIAVAWFLLTKTLPKAEERADKRDAAFTEAMSKRDAALSAALEKQHLDHKEEGRIEREHHEKQVEKILSKIDELDCAPNGRGSRG